MKILITGSREASQRLIDIARGFVEHFPQAEFIVGDAPGIDAAVIAACDRIGARVLVCGAHGQCRNATKQQTNVYLTCSYQERDRFMVDEGHPDQCVAFWNGSSAGTLATAKYARSKGVPTILCK